MLTWEHVLIQNLTPPFNEVWVGKGGGGMSVVAYKETGYELTAWWDSQHGKGQLTATQPTAYPTLEEAQAVAQQLIFARTDDWSRLLEEPYDAP